MHHSPDADVTSPRRNIPRKRRRTLLGTILVIILAMFVLPYTLLTDINAWYGSFLFWTVATVIVLGIVTYLSWGWDQAEDPTSDGAR